MSLIQANGNATTVVRSPTASTVATTGRVYVQRDKNDDPARAVSLRSELAKRSLNVVEGIEAIDSQKMPTLAQVRYFNADDEAVARGALSVLQEAYPIAILKRIRLPAPTGQLEVWLPRTGP